VSDGGGFTSAREPRCELLDLEKREVWQDCGPTPREWWDAVELPPGFVKVGYGAGNMDRMRFRRSPGAEADGPLREREIAGRRFFHCASPLGAMEGGSPRRLRVDKHHSLLYEAGREVGILTTDSGGEYVHVVDGAPGAPEPALPEGWSIRTLVLDAEWIVDLPAPCETFWFEGMVSYQGPLDRTPETG